LLAPLFGVGVMVEALIAATHGVSVFSAVVLTMIGLYLMVGMLFYAALRTALIVMLAYMIGANATHMPSEQMAYNFLVLLATNLVGASVCYALERVHRTNYLEARLLTEMACRDGLTGIYNRRMLDEHLDKVWQQAGRERVFVALLLVDIDHFKAYNDYYGHQAGDECLKSVAQTLMRSARRPLDFTARYNTPLRPARNNSPSASARRGCCPRRNAVTSASCNLPMRRCTRQRARDAIALSSWTKSTKNSTPARSARAMRRWRRDEEIDRSL
jgi:hypothetical protein